MAVPSRQPCNTMIYKVFSQKSDYWRQRLRPWKYLSPVYGSRGTAHAQWLQTKRIVNGYLWQTYRISKLGEGFDHVTRHV